MLKSVQAGRAIAAICVAAFHLSIMMGDVRYGGVPVFQDYTIQGNLGVDYFFLLSGFIIMYAHGQDIGRPAALGNYLWRRWARLFPVYWLYTAGFTLLVLLGLGSAAVLPSTPLEWLTSVTLVRFSPVDPPLPVAWTLFYELAFYLAFAVLIANRRAGIALFVAWGAVCLVTFKYPGQGINTPAFVYTAISNLYFMMGIGAYLLMRRPGTGTPELLLGAAVVATVVALWPDAGSRHGEFPLVIGLAFLMAGITKLERTRGSLPIPKWLLKVGDASYSLYLLHLPLQGLLLKLLVASGLLRMIGGEASYLAVLAGSVLLSCGAYAFVELPLLDRFRSRRSKARGRRELAADPTPP